MTLPVEQRDIAVRVARAFVGRYAGEPAGFPDEVSGAAAIGDFAQDTVQASK